MWDGNLDTPPTIALLREMGTRTLRCMGGSLSDNYHWVTDLTVGTDWPGPWPSSFANLLHAATNIGAQVVTTVNYGTGSTNEAAAWVAYANGATTNTLSLGRDQFGTNWQTVGYWASLRAAAPLGHDDGKNFLRISLWWDLRNGTDTSGCFDSTLYGWRTYGDLGMVNGLTNRHPTFYAAKLMRSFAQAGDTILNPSSDYLLLSAYAARGTNGALSLLVLNKDTATNFNAQVSLAGFEPCPTATVRSYGISQDDATRTNAPIAARDIATNNFVGAGANFNYSFPALSLTLFTFAPAAPSLVVLPPAPRPGGQFVFQLQGQPGARYYVQNSTNLSAWTTVSTNWLTGSTLNITNPVPAGAAISFWRAVWQP